METPNNVFRFRNGDTMPAVGIGTWKMNPDEIAPAIRSAIQIGYRHIDCAPIYGNELEIGSALSEIIHPERVPRKSVWITTKLWNDAHHPAAVEPSLENSLEDLRLDYVDLFLMHWPVAVKKGVYVPKSAADLISLDALPLLDTWRAMEKLVDKGLCRHIGVSNFNTSKLQHLIENARIKPEVNQVELHPYLQQVGLLETCREWGVHVTAYAPLGSKDRPIGLKFPNEPTLLNDPVIGSIAEAHGATPAQILISWGLNRGTSVIPKSVDPTRQGENLAAGEIQLTLADLTRIAALERNQRYLLGDFFELDGSPYTVSGLWDY